MREIDKIEPLCDAIISRLPVTEGLKNQNDNEARMRFNLQLEKEEYGQLGRIVPVLSTMQDRPDLPIFFSAKISKYFDLYGQRNSRQVRPGSLTGEKRGEQIAKATNTYRDRGVCLV